MEITQKPISRNRAMLYMLACALTWSTGGVLIKYIDANPFVISGWRSVLALPVLMLVFPPKTMRFTKQVWIIASTIASAGVLFVIATKLTTAANAIVLQYCSPVFIILINHFAYRERARKADILVSAATIAGMALFFVDKLSAGNMLGNFLAILSGVICALSFVFMNRTTEDRGTICIAAQIEAIIACLPFMFLFPPKLTVQASLALIALGVFQRGFSTILYSRGIGYCSPMDAALISMAEPICSPLLVMLFFDETPGKFALMGSVIVIASVILWNIANVRAVNRQ